MSPAIKYTLGRIGLFVLVLLPLWPLEINVWLKLMIALFASFGLSYFLLRRWRNELSDQVAGAVERRRAERERLKSALAGEDDERDSDVPH